MSAYAMILVAEDPVPEDEDVVAGSWGAVILVLLIALTVLLMWSFVRQLRKAQAAKDAGVYGDEPAEIAESDEDPDRLADGGSG
jgi:hypothetical protein